MIICIRGYCPDALREYGEVAFFSDAPLSWGPSSADPDEHERLREQTLRDFWQDLKGRVPDEGFLRSQPCGLSRLQQLSASDGNAAIGVYPEFEDALFCLWLLATASALRLKMQYLLFPAPDFHLATPLSEGDLARAAAWWQAFCRGEAVDVRPSRVLPELAEDHHATHLGYFFPQPATAGVALSAYDHDLLSVLSNEYETAALDLLAKLPDRMNWIGTLQKIARLNEWAAGDAPTVVVRDRSQDWRTARYRLTDQGAKRLRAGLDPQLAPVYYVGGFRVYRDDWLYLSSTDALARRV